MFANTFNTLFRVTSFGESHGPAMGVVVDGLPAGVKLSLPKIQAQLDRRRPGRSNVTSARQESDQVEILSGLLDGITLGTPLAAVVRNIDSKSQDYQLVEQSPRKGHADSAWKLKYGIHDHRGGGRSSGRETVSRVIAGSIAHQTLSQIVPEATPTVSCWVTAIGPLVDATSIDRPIGDDLVDQSPVRMLNPDLSSQATQMLTQAKSAGESYGCRIAIRIDNAPSALGMPVFRKLKADLASAMMGVGAVVSVSFDDLAGAARGTEFHQSSNTYSGIQGGISNGSPIVLGITMKPTSSILDVAKAGRHDPCIGIRAVPVFQSMVHLVLVEHLLARRLDTANFLTIHQGGL